MTEADKSALRIFLSTPSARRATVQSVEKKGSCRFLSTPSARRATCQGVKPRNKRVNFYPRPPRGGRPVRRRLSVAMSNFYPRPPRGGRQQKQRQNLYF